MDKNLTGVVFRMFRFIIAKIEIVMGISGILGFGPLREVLRMVYIMYMISLRLQIFLQQRVVLLYLLVSTYLNARLREQHYRNADEGYQQNNDLD